MSIEIIYNYTYTLIATIILVGVLKKQQFPTNINGNGNISYLCMLLVVVLVIVIGNRPISVGADTTQYIQDYYYLQGSEYHFDKETSNLIFDNLYAFIGSLNMDVYIAFSLMAAIYFGCMYIACRKLFPQNQEIAFFSCLIAFSTFSYGVNGMKAGAAASLFLVALAYKDTIWVSVMFAFLSVGFHHSMVVVAYAYILTSFYRNTKMYFYGWGLAVLLATSHISFFQTLFANYADESGKGYLTSDVYLTGFRPDFILYSAMPVIVGYIMIFKKKIKNDKYELWLRMYITTNSVWMLCMYSSYTNRIAYLSWFMYPIVLLMPFYAIRTSGNQLVVGKKVVLYHLSFTLFMVVVYYGLLR